MDKIETCDIYISGNINRELIDNILEKLKKDVYQPHKCLRMIIDSPGGSISYAISLARFLMGCFPTIYTYNLNSVDSAAVCLFLAGSKRFALPAACFFMHPPSIDVTGNHTEDQLKELLQKLQADTARMVQYYTERTTSPIETWESIFKQTKQMNAAEMQGYGVVTDICYESPLFLPSNILSTHATKSPH